MTEERFYKAQEIANALDAPHRNDPPYKVHYENYSTMIFENYDIEPSLFDEIARASGINVTNKPDAISHNPVTIHWWDVEHPHYVVVGRAEDKRCFGFSRHIDAAMRIVSEQMDEDMRRLNR